MCKTTNVAGSMPTKETKANNDKKTSPPPSPTLSGQAIFYMVLLVFQFGMQPMLTRTFTPKEIDRYTVILMQEILKFFLAFSMLYMSGSMKSAIQGWTIPIWVGVALLPAALYAVQNLCALQAYQTLDSLTFNVLNQTKTLSAALCCYIIMGRKQSPMQIVSLFLLLTSALVMERLITFDSMFGKLFFGVSKDNINDNNQINNDNVVDDDLSSSAHWSNGVLNVLMASFISGLTGALSQRNLQSLGGGGRNSYLFSMELCAASALVIIITLLINGFFGDATTKRKNVLFEPSEFWNHWTVWTWIPIFTNSVGGILVGLVTKHAGSVQKGFALIFGIFISGITQAIMSSSSVSKEQVAGGVLAAISLWMHATNPYVATTPDSKSKQE